MVKRVDAMMVRAQAIIMVASSTFKRPILALAKMRKATTTVVTSPKTQKRIKENNQGRDLH